MRLSSWAARSTLGGAAAFLTVCLLSACTDEGDKSASKPIPRVGLMHVGTDHIPPSLPSLEARLKELGWTKGHNIRLVWRNLEPGEAEGQAKEFVRERVNVIVAFEDQSIRAAQAATAKPKNRIPIVFLHPSDPVRDGLVKSLSHPGGNLTGVFGARDVVAKQLELYQLLVPHLRRVLTLVDPSDPGTGRLLAQYRAAASQLRPSPRSRGPQGLDRAGPQASVRVAAARRGRRCLPSVVEASAQLFGADDPARRPREAPGAGAQERLGPEEVRSSPTGPTSDPSGGWVPATSTASSRALDPPTCPSKSFPVSSSRSICRTASRLGIRIPQQMIIRAKQVYP